MGIVIIIVERREFAGRDDAPLWTRWELPICESMRRNERRRLLSDAMMTKQGAEE